MARRKKNRTHVPVTRTTQKDGTPKSFVIKAAGHGHGSVGSSVGMLVKDVRRVMEPNTASSLKVRARFESESGGPAVLSLFRILMRTGAKVASTPRLYRHGWTPRRNPHDGLLPILPLPLFLLKQRIYIFFRIQHERQFADMSVAEGSDFDFQGVEV